MADGLPAGEDERSLRACVVGGLGAMGSMLAGRLAASGLRVGVVDIRQGRTGRGGHRIRASDIVVAAVPIRALEEVIPEICSAMRRDSLLIEIGSVKQHPVRLLRESCRASFVACHPMFGPSEKRLEGRAVYLCEWGGDPSWKTWFDGLMRSWGLHVVRIDPEAHDRLVSVLQVMRQHLLLGFATAASRAGLTGGMTGGVDGSALGDLYGGLLEMCGRQLREDPRLWRDMTAYNPFAAESLSLLTSCLEEVVSASRRHDDCLESLLAEAARAVEEAGGVPPPDPTPVRPP